MAFRETISLSCEHIYFPKSVTASKLVPRKEKWGPRGKKLCRNFLTFLEINLVNCISSAIFCIFIGVCFFLPYVSYHLVIECGSKFLKKERMHIYIF